MDEDMKQAHADAVLIKTLSELSDLYGALGVGKTLLEMFPAIKDVLTMEPVEAKDFDFAPAESFGAPGVGQAYSNLASYLTHPPTENANACQREPVRAIKHDGVYVDYGDQGCHVAAQTDLARRILRVHLPAAMEHFLRRNAEYGEESHVLGIKGQYADINRKVIKLKRYLWDDVPVQDGAESIGMIAQELIGHLLILIDELNQKEN